LDGGNEFFGGKWFPKYRMIAHKPDVLRQKIARHDARRRVRHDSRFGTGPKILYEELDDIAGDKGWCRVLQGTLASRLGVDARQILRWELLLGRHDYLNWKRTGRSSIYTLAYVGAKNDPTKMSHQMRHSSPVRSDAVVGCTDHHQLQARPTLKALRKAMMMIRPKNVKTPSKN